eukprot:tig00000663_g2977.t1
MQRWQIDEVKFAGQDAKSLITLEDVFSKWMMAHVKPVANSRTVIEALEAEFKEHGLPLEIECDQGTAFISKDVQAYLAEKGVRLVIMPAYAPQTKGALERGHQTLEAKIRTLTEEHRGTSWTKWVDAALHAMRTTQHSATGFTPFRLHKGYDPFTSLDLKFSSLATLGSGAAQLAPSPSALAFGPGKTAAENDKEDSHTIWRWDGTCWA